MIDFARLHARKEKGPNLALMRKVRLRDGEDGFAMAREKKKYVGSARESQHGSGR